MINISAFSFFPPASTEDPVMVTRAQTLTVADASLVFVKSWLMLRFSGLQACAIRFLYGDSLLILDLISKVLRSDIKLSFTYSKFTNYL